MAYTSKFTSLLDFKIAEWANRRRQLFLVLFLQLQIDIVELLCATFEPDMVIAIEEKFVLLIKFFITYILELLSGQEQLKYHFVVVLPVSRSTQENLCRRSMSQASETRRSSEPSRSRLVSSR